MQGQYAYCEEEEAEEDEDGDEDSNDEEEKDIDRTRGGKGGAVGEYWRRLKENAPTEEEQKRVKKYSNYIAKQGKKRRNALAKAERLIIGEMGAEGTIIDDVQAEIRIRMWIKRNWVGHAWKTWK